MRPWPSRCGISRLASPELDLGAAAHLQRPPQRGSRSRPGPRRSRCACALHAALVCNSTSVLGLPEIHAERPQLAIEMRALHADTFRQLSDLAIAQLQLLREIGALEMLACFTQ